MNDAEPNRYSAAWFQFFHVGIAAARTEQEAAFVRRCCPLPDFTRVLDVCCGMGRHARRLAADGYIVTGIERDEPAVLAARAQGGGPDYVQADVRAYQPEPGSCDAAVILSQSFGYFDPDTNRAVLARLGVGLRPGGRIVLDVWNPDFFVPRQGQFTFELPAGSVRETKRVASGRLFTRLDYPDGGCDEFEFQTFTSAEMADFARSAGLVLVTACTGFDATVLPDADKPRIQFVLERR